MSNLIRSFVVFLAENIYAPKQGLYIFLTSWTLFGRYFQAVTSELPVKILISNGVGGYGLIAEYELLEFHYNKEEF